MPSRGCSFARWFRKLDRDESPVQFSQPSYSEPLDQRNRLEGLESAYANRQRWPRIVLDTLVWMDLSQQRLVLVLVIVLGRDYEYRNLVEEIQILRAPSASLS
jgi:hypothetical protein